VKESRLRPAVITGEVRRALRGGAATAGSGDGGQDRDG